MEKDSLIGVSIVVIIFFILSSLTNVIGYQAVQSSNLNAMNSEVDQKELLLQTIADIVNNKDIRRILTKSQINKGEFFNPDIRFSIFHTPVVTKNQLKNMYIVGLLLSKIISKSRMHTLLERYQLINQPMQKEITDVFKKDATVNQEITLLANSDCDCEKENDTGWNFPIICTLLVPFLAISFALFFILDIYIFLQVMEVIGLILNCIWT